MSLMKLGADEVVRADVTAPVRSLFFPLLELLLITGVAWMAIGWADHNGIDVMLRNAMVAIWAWLAVWRFVMPLYRARRERFIVTDRRVIARMGKNVDSIPLRDIHSAKRRRGGMSLALHGYDRPMFYPRVPKGKRVEDLINYPHGW